MPDDTQSATPKTFGASIMSLNPKIVLAFFLVTLAAALVVFFIVLLVNRPAGSPALDPGTIALLSGFVTTFLLMAKSASDYQFTSSAGSDKKDDAQTAVSKALAEKVPAPPAPPAPVAPPAVVVAWWSLLTDSERAVVTAAAASDPKAASFMAAAQTGKAVEDDLADLVTKGLLTQARADTIKAS